LQKRAKGIIFDMAIIWDDEKDRENIKKHGISFKDAQYVFLDPARVERRDDDHSEGEQRWQTLGFFHDVLFVVFTERGEDTRLITARIAEPRERRIYYGDSTQYPKGWGRVNP
jgi:uncharacterized DUF497 family protein